MFGRRVNPRTSSAFLAIALFASTTVSASQFNVVVDTGSSLVGTAATLVFDFSDGDPVAGPNNEVRLSFGLATSSNTSTSGADVSFSGPPDDVWVFTDLDTGAINPRSLYVDFASLPSSLTFSFTTTDNAPLPGVTPDQFAFTFLDAALSPLFPTTDPLGLDALFRFDIDGSAILGPYGPTTETEITGFSVSITPVAEAPEPGLLALLAIGFGAMFARRRVR